MARKLGSPTLSWLKVSRDLELENKATNTGLGLVAEMNLVESRIGGGDESGGNRTGGGFMLQVDSDWHDGDWYFMAYMDSDWWWICGGGRWQRRLKLVRWWYMAAMVTMMVNGSGGDDGAATAWQLVNRTRNSRGLDTKTSHQTWRCNRKFNTSNTEKIMQRLRLVRIGWTNPNFLAFSWTIGMKNRLDLIYEKL